MLMYDYQIQKIIVVFALFYLYVLHYLLRRPEKIRIHSTLLLEIY